MRSEFILINIVHSLNAILLIVWGIASRINIAKGKASVLIMMKCSFIIVICIYLVVWLIATALVLTMLNRQCDLNEDLTFIVYLKAYLPVCGGFLVLSAGSMAVYMYNLSKHLHAVISFHIFLNNYRQTPRSRNLKKY